MFFFGRLCQIPLIFFFTLLPPPNFSRSLPPDPRARTQLRLSLWACRRSPAQPVITLAVTSSPSPPRRRRQHHYRRLPPSAPFAALARSRAAISAVLPLRLCKSVAKKNEAGGRSCKLHCRSCVQANAATPPQSKQDVAPVEWELASAQRPQSLDQPGEIVRAAVLFVLLFSPYPF